MALDERRRRFVEAYMGQAAGNATEAARLAGYSPRTAKQQGARLLTFVDVKQAIENRQQNDPAIATREERQRFWTNVMNDRDADMKDRLRASEILGKASGDFVDRVETDNQHKVQITLRRVRQEPDDNDS